MSALQVPAPGAATIGPVVTGQSYRIRNASKLSSILLRLAREGKSLWIGVKGGPVIDDLTEAEARGIGLSVYGEIVSNGNQGVGTDLDLCPPGFQARIASSDLVLSKGQANFETLVGRVRHAFFLLRCKCPVVSRALGRKEGEMIVLDGEAAA